MTPFTFKQANRRYVQVFLPVMTFYVLFCFAAPALLRAFAPPPQWAVALVALLSGAPIVGVFWLLGRFLRETDEYTRKIQTDAMLSGGAITLSAAVMWSFLGLYKVIPSSAHGPAMMMIGPSFFAAYGLSMAVQMRRSRRPGRE